MSIKAVLFDLDGTLIDSSEGIINCVRYALDYYGIQEDNRKILYSFIGPPLRDSFQRYYGFDKEKAAEAVAKYRERYHKTGIFECILYPQVKETIEILKEQGYRIGMASSKPEESCRRILKHFGILPLFDDVVGATMDGRIDTKEEVLSEVFCRWQELSRDEMCLIGDTMFDVNGAVAHQIPCIAVSYGFGDIAEMLEHGACLRCDDLSQLPGLLKMLSSGEELYEQK